MTPVTGWSHMSLSLSHNHMTKEKNIEDFGINNII